MKSCIKNVICNYHYWIVGWFKLISVFSFMLFFISYYFLHIFFYTNLCYCPKKKQWTSWLSVIVLIFIKFSLETELNNIVFVVQSLSHVWLLATLWTTALQTSLSFISPGVCSDSCPLSPWCYVTISPSASLFSSCPRVFPSPRVFSNESALQIRWPKYGNLSFSISPYNEYSVLISFRIGWFDILAV